MITRGATLRGLRVYLSGPTSVPAAIVAAELAVRGARVAGTYAGRDLDDLQAAHVLGLLPGWEECPEAYCDALFATGLGIDVVPAAEILGNA